MEKILKFLESLWGLFTKLFTTTIYDLQVVQVVILVIVLFFLFKILKEMFKIMKKGAKVFGKGLKSGFAVLSAKNRASKKVCLHCGRTLDKCICPANKGLSNSKKLKKHKLEVRALKLAKKAKK